MTRITIKNEKDQILAVLHVPQGEIRIRETNGVKIETDEHQNR